VVDALVRRLMRKIEQGAPDIQKYESSGLVDAKVAVVAYGSSARSAKAAIRFARHKGLAVGLFRPITLWPFPEAELAEVAAKVRHIVVPEMNLGQLSLEVERVVRGRCAVHQVNRVTGEPIPPEQILEAIQPLAG
jgi:2-oxoglutarate ferredoxin oxidoreductase subunit alpha